MKRSVAPSWEPLTQIGPQVQWVVGVDEAGRGAWAGPVTAAAVLLPVGQVVDGVRDSKVLSPMRREQLDYVIRRQATAIGVGWASAAEVDDQGLSWAVQKAGQRALASITQPVDLIILDGNWNYLADHPTSTLTIIKADASVVPVAAASVVAKVARDRYMQYLYDSAGNYGFAQHKGYMTPGHQQAVAKAGLGPYHRRRWSY